MFKVFYRTLYAMVIAFKCYNILFSNPLKRKKYVKPRIVLNIGET